VVVGMKPATSELPDARKLIEKTTNVLGGILSPLKAKLAAMGETKAPPPPSAAKPEASGAPEAPTEPPAAPAPAPPRPSIASPARPANAPLDRVVIRVGEGTAQKANMVLARKGIRDAKVDGDRLEFVFASNRVSTVLKTLLEAHIELYGLERTESPDSPARPG
jgi:hypothetical protein